MPIIFVMKFVFKFIMFIMFIFIIFYEIGEDGDVVEVDHEEAEGEGGD